MDIRSSLDGLKSLLGTAAPVAAPPSGNRSALGASAIGSDQVTFSSAASEVAGTAADPTVRQDKVAAVQAAIAAGTYSVSPSAIASKLVTAMLGQ